MAREFQQPPEYFQKAEQLKNIFNTDQLQLIAWAMKKQIISLAPDSDTYNRRVLEILRIFDEAAGTKYAEDGDNMADTIEYSKTRNRDGSLK